jgi:hypothetical protein
VLAETTPEAGRRVLSAAQIATVRAFLADLRTGWDQQPPRLRNEFLRLMLDQVVVNVDCDHVEATMTWRTGVQQLWIGRPLRRHRGKPYRSTFRTGRTWPFGSRRQRSG